MHSLYVDSTSGLVIGLLDANFKWVSYNDTNEKKPSEVIHVEIYNLIKKYNLDLTAMNFFFSAGPGSYTGMRLGEGIAQVLAWEDRNVFSFLHFEVPKIIGVKKGFWVTNAFKGQVFSYNFSHLKNTKDLIKNSSELIFSHVYKEKMREAPYYFRTLDEEFK